MKWIVREGKERRKGRYLDGANTWKESRRQARVFDHKLQASGYAGMSGGRVVRLVPRRTRATIVESWRLLGGHHSCVLMTGAVINGRDFTRVVDTCPMWIDTFVNGNQICKTLLRTWAWTWTCEWVDE